MIDQKIGFSDLHEAEFEQGEDSPTQLKRAVTIKKSQMIEDQLKCRFQSLYGDEDL
jgi:hypothetical protein